MACIYNLFVGDVGTSVEFEITECINGVEGVVDISSATAMDVTFLKGDGATTLIVGMPDVQFLTDGTDGVAQYVTKPGDIDLAGSWKAQIKVTTPAGSWSATINKFKVKDVI